MSDLRRRLVERGNPVGLSTLSYWRSGQRVPEGTDSLLVVRDIEDILGLPSGHLHRSVEASRRHTSTSQDVDELVRRAGLAAMVDELALDGPLNGLERTWAQGAVTLDADGRMRLVESRGLFRAGRPGIDRFAQFFVALQPAAESIRFERTSGCTPGRSVNRPEAGLFAGELTLPRVLRADEEVLLEWAFEPPEMASATRFEAYLPERVPDFMLTLSFHADRLPQTAEAYREPPGRPVEVTPLHVDGFTTLHHRERNFGPGTLGLRWEW